MPSPLQSWFQSSEDLTRQAAGNVTVMKFQVEQLVRLARTQRQKIQADKLYWLSVLQRTRTPNIDIDNITRQFREMRAERDTALKQNEDLRVEVGMLKASANRRMQPQRGYANLPTNAPHLEPPLGHNRFERSHRRPFVTSPGDGMVAFLQPRTAPELRHCPNTAEPHMYQNESEELRSGMAYAARAPPRTRRAGQYGIGGPRNNLEQFRYRGEAAVGGSVSLDLPRRPSFTLADSGRRHQRERAGSAQQGFISQSRNNFSVPTRFNNMDPINEITEDVDPFRV
ncbi:hypothetical protein CspeluHIS016_0304160 [Cutaneotrichosporon spelunceum]|uniref:Uncharacterized protein n=1 Tax=Cutaneotrichosporon spelunceum TaxID=1672016 RepID=A0AAD3TTE3_9TREE|nr:hypothetical protein CspeluHIS016_0304160 [Cutaneotrichosporon spelunceum]